MAFAQGEQFHAALVLSTGWGLLFLFLVRDTEETVGAIAAAVGYRSEYSFSRAFTRHRGIAPGRYRRHARARALATAVSLDGRNFTIWPAFANEYKRRLARFDPAEFELTSAPVAVAMG